MSGSWPAVARFLSKRTFVTIALAIAVTLGMGFGLRQLDFSTGQNSYIDPSSKAAKDNERYQSLFGGESMVVLFTVDQGKTIADLFTPANVAQLIEVDSTLRNSSAVHSVVSPVTLLQWTSDLVTKGVASEIIARTIQRETDPAAAELRQQDALITAMRIGTVKAQDLSDPAWVKFLIFGNNGFSTDASGRLAEPADSELVVRKALRAFIPDSRHAVFAGLLVGNAPLDDLADGSNAVHDAFQGRTFDNATVIITGTPTFLTDINDYLQGGMLTLGGIAVLVMIVILLVAFKVRWRLLPLLGMAAGVAWGFGVFGFTRTKLSLVTIAGLPILIGLGIEFAIQIQNRIEEEQSEQRRTQRSEVSSDTSRGPFGETLVRIGPPLVTATIAAAIAFLTVRMSKVPMVQDFGVLLAIGIVALLVAGIVLPTMVIGARERRSPTTTEPTKGWVEATVDWLGKMPRAAVLPLVLIAIVVPVLGLVLEGGSKIESDPINWADQSSASIRNARTLERETGFATTLGVFVETNSSPSNGVFTDQMGAFVFDLVTRATRENRELAEASSLATTVGWLSEVPNTTSLPPTGLDMLEAYNVAPSALQELLVAENANVTQVLFQVGASSLEQRAEVLTRTQQAINDPGQGALLPARAVATTGGLVVVGVGLLDNLTTNRAQLTIVALLLVGAFVILRSRDLARGLVTMIPVLVAVGAAATIVRVLGITLSPLTTVGGPLVVATCAEFCVLLVARYAEERAKGLEPGAGTRVAAERAGRAFFTSALATLGGFAVLMFSSLPLLADFGTVVTINIAVALLSALVVVPPLLREADRHGLLSMGLTPAEGHAGRRRSAIGWVAGSVLAATGITVLFVSVHEDTVSPVVARAEAAIEPPATIPPPTTVPPTTVPPNTAQPTNSSVPAGSTAAEGSTASSDTTIAVETTLAPGPAERPAGLIEGIFWDTLTGVGVDPGVARCAADDVLAGTSEADLMALGIASVPRPEAVNTLLDASATRCGVTRQQLDAAAAAAGG